MRINELTLQTSKLQEVKSFYTKILGLEINEETFDMFSVKIGWSTLRFKKSTTQHLYHYCFLIPSNVFEEALEWMVERVAILEIENGEKIVNFEEWNAQSFYFYDGSGNIAEFIVHHDLNNDIYQEFNIAEVLGISEIGIGTDDVKKINSILEETCQTEFWKGDLIRFGTNGAQEGKFLLSNYNEKETWFPTQIKIEPSPFEIKIENKGKLYQLKYIDGALMSIQEI